MVDLETPNALQPADDSVIREVMRQQMALDNFQQICAIRPGDNVIMLLDRLIDPRVPAAFWGMATARAARVKAVTEEVAAISSIPDYVKPLLEEADFVVSTWFCSTFDAFCKKLRKEDGQRWVKITYFRNLDAWKTEQAAFPIEIISKLLTKTAEAYPRYGPVTMRVTDERGTDLKFDLTEEYVDALASTSRWRGELTAQKPGSYVHYLPTHGPNMFSGSASHHEDTTINGVLYPQWGVAFPKPFGGTVAIEIRDSHVHSVSGDAPEVALLQKILPGALYEELGCGFNPKAYRTHLYPAGSNSPGAMHFGLNLTKEADYVKTTLPEWPEAPMHMDLVSLDATVQIGDTVVVDNGFLTALRDPDVRAVASKYGEPAYLLEAWPGNVELRPGMPVTAQ